YKGKTLGIDAYVWLHRGAYAYAQSIALGESNTRYINYAIHRIRMLQHYGVTPYVVFDGGLLSAKKATESDRDRRRKEALAAGKKALQEGKKSLARDYFIKAVDVTPAMAFQLIKVTKCLPTPD
ncbi:PIN domain-like protein, partial [Atractiella rhizophila]